MPFACKQSKKSNDVTVCLVSSFETELTLPNVPHWSIDPKTFHSIGFNAFALDAKMPFGRLDYLDRRIVVEKVNQEFINVVFWQILVI